MSWLNGTDQLFCLDECPPLDFLLHSVNAFNVNHRVCEDRVFPDHPREICSLDERRNQFLKGKLIVSVLWIGRFRNSNCSRNDEVFVHEFVASRSIGEFVREHLVHPMFEDSGNAVPIKGEFKDDGIGPEQGPLLGADVDFEIRIERIKVSNLDAGFFL